MKKKRKQKLAKRLELWGLILLLTASVWQFFITDWLTEQFEESHKWIEREIYYDILRSQEDIATLFTTDSIQWKLDIANRIHTRNSERVFTTVKRRDEREENWKKKPKFQIFLGATLFILGSGLIVYGKYLELPD